MGTTFSKKTRGNERPRSDSQTSQDSMGDARAGALVTRKNPLDTIINKAIEDIGTIADATYSNQLQKEAFRDGALLIVFIGIGGTFPATFFVKNSINWVNHLRTNYPFLSADLLNATEWILTKFGVGLNAIFNGASYYTVYSVILKDWLLGFFYALNDIRLKKPDAGLEAFQKGAAFGINTTLTYFASNGFYISGREAIPDQPILRKLAATSNTFVAGAGVSQVSRLLYKFSSRIHTANVIEKLIPAPIPQVPTESTNLLDEEVGTSNTKYKTELYRQLVYLELKRVTAKLGQLTNSKLRSKRFRTIVGYSSPGHVEQKFDKFKNNQFITSRGESVTTENIIKDALDLVDDNEITTFNLWHLLSVASPIIGVTFTAIIGYTLLVAAEAYVGNTIGDWIAGVISMLPDFGIVLEFDVGVIMSFFAINAMMLSNVPSYKISFLMSLMTLSVVALGSFGATANATWNGLEDWNAGVEVCTAGSLITAVNTDIINMLAVERVCTLFVTLWGQARKNPELVSAKQFTAFVGVITSTLQNIGAKSSGLTLGQCETILDAILDQTMNDRKDEFLAFINNDSDNFAHLRGLLTQAKKSGLAPSGQWEKDNQWFEIIESTAVNGEHSSDSNSLNSDHPSLPKGHRDGEQSQFDPLPA